MSRYAEALALFDAQTVPYVDAEYGASSRVVVTHRDDFHTVISDGHGSAPATLDTPCLTFNVEGTDVAAGEWSEPTEWPTLREALLEMYGGIEGEPLPAALADDAL